ncbi:MAG: hypothetical protein IPF58_15000 [Saprospirales bacterium]|nr:hypothetical protein [Saprospirales bacterium]
MRKLLLSFLMLIAIVSVNAQSISVTSNGFVYTQDFNSLPTTGHLQNLYCQMAGTLISIQVDLQKTVFKQLLAQQLRNKDFYSVGAAANSERALGTLISNANAPMYIGVKCVNNTGSTITAVQISYKWNNGVVEIIQLHIQIH